MTISRVIYRLNFFFTEAIKIKLRILMMEKVNRQSDYFVSSLEKSFSAKYYIKNNIDVKETKVDPFEHFISFGWKEKRNPNLWFDIQYYLEKYPDVEKAGINPFLHYIRIGQFEKRKTSKLISKEQYDYFIRNRFFDEEYYERTYEDVRSSNIDPFEHYLKIGFTEDRNPSLTFDNFFYRHKYGISQCPLMHFFEHPENETLPENAITFNINSPIELRPNIRVAVQLHLYYPDLCYQILNSLKNFPYEFDLFISVVSESDVIFAQNIFEQLPNKRLIDVRLVENAGRDISPLLITFSDVWTNYDYLCHIHTKRSLHTHFGDLWRTYLFDKIIGSNKIVGQVLSHFENNPDIAILYPENYFEIKKYTLSNSDGNNKKISQILSSLGLPIEDDYSMYPFAAGSMQWFNTKFFKPLRDLDLKYADFKNSNINVDGTLAHAIERLFSIFCYKVGAKVLSYYSDLENRSLLSESRAHSMVYDRGSNWMRDDPTISKYELKKLVPSSQFYNRNSLNIHWVIPDFISGAGGHMTIFRMVYFLEQMGHRQTIWIQNCYNYRLPSMAKRAIEDYYQPIGDLVDVHFLPNDIDWISGDAVFATDCWSAYPVSVMRRFKQRFYFIQDYEPMFHPMGENYLIARQTYEFGFTAICAGEWLKIKAENHGMRAYSFPLCSDSTIYKVDNREDYREVGKINIAFYSRSYTPRRAVRLGLSAFVELSKRVDNVHLHCFGQDDLPFVPDIAHTNHGIMTPNELSVLYNSCDIGVVFSATNYSLIPLEMMGCGLPIVELDVESTRYVFSEDMVSFAKPNVHSITDTIETLLLDKNRQSHQIKTGIEFLKDLSWQKAANKIQAAIFKEIENNSNYIGVDVHQIKNPGYSSVITATVVIPTLNAESQIEALVERILSQKAPFEFDILVIDSESDDRTLEILNCYIKQYDKISVISIPRNEFQHGRTRDLGIKMATGDYVAFLTQDALPYDDCWFDELIKGFAHDDKIIGVFGRHIAYHEHSPFVRRDIDNHFQHFAQLPRIYSWDDAMPSHIRRGSKEWQMKMMFYSDNSSAICKSAWLHIPYPHVDWGEDQIWAWKVIQLGLKKFYAHDSVVVHSHDDSFEKRFEISSIENTFFSENFGLSLYQNEEQAQQVLNSLNYRDKSYAEKNSVDNCVLEKQLKLNLATIKGRSGYV